MIIEVKETVTLTEEEKEAINQTYMLMCDILREVNDPDIYNAVKQTCEGLEEFECVVDIEEKI